MLRRTVALLVFSFVAALSTLGTVSGVAHATVTEWEQLGSFDDVSVADDGSVRAVTHWGSVLVLDETGKVLADFAPHYASSVDTNGLVVLLAGGNTVSVTDMAGRKIASWSGTIATGSLGPVEIWGEYAMVLVPDQGVVAFDLAALEPMQVVVPPASHGARLSLAGTVDRFLISSITGSTPIDESYRLTVYEIGRDLDIVRTTGPIELEQGDYPCVEYCEADIAPGPDGGFYLEHVSALGGLDTLPAPAGSLYSEDGVRLETVQVLPGAYTGISIDVDRCFNLLGASRRGGDGDFEGDRGFEWVPASHDLGCFLDVATTVFEHDIAWLGRNDVTRGCDPPQNKRFCPDRFVTRGQLAAFLNRALGLPPTDIDAFLDDDESVFEDDINRVAAAGITKGCNPPDNDAFCPDGNVTREQMAAFLVRGFGYTDDGGGDLFGDDDRSIFEADIDKLATAGVTKGCNPPDNDRFCPTQNVTRGQMAAFLHRALG